MLKIAAKLKRHHSETVLIVPCSDCGIDITLLILGETDSCEIKQFCSYIESEIPGFSTLQNRFINIDELNYLAKRLNSLDHRELNQFKSAMEVTKPKELKDMITETC